MKVSVIIAAYNAEKYIRQTLDAILTQTLDSYEVIVVNDGSTDRTLSILEEYGSRHGHLRVLTKENAGPAIARNYGIRRAQGDFLYFLDADDIPEPDALKLLYDRAVNTGADVVIARYDIFGDYSSHPVTNIDDITSLDEISKYDPRLLKSFTLWNKLFRKDTLIVHEITFPDLSYSEDGVFTMRMIMHADRIAGLPRVILHYRRDLMLNSSTLTASVSTKKLEHFLKAHDLIFRCIVRQLKEEMIPAQISRELIHAFQVKELTTLLMQFYTHYNRADKSCRDLIVSTIMEKLKEATPSVRTEITDRYRELLPPQAHENPLITAALYAEEADETYFKTLAGVLTNTFTGFKLYLPGHLREATLSQLGSYDCITWLSCSDRNLFYEIVSSQCRTPLCILLETGYILNYKALETAYQTMRSCCFDFYSEVIYQPSGSTGSVSFRSALSYHLWNTGMNDPRIREYDGVLSNKVFRSDFLKSVYRRNAGITTEELLRIIFLEGTHGFYNHNVILSLTPDSLSACFRPISQVSLQDARVGVNIANRNILPWRKESRIHHNLFRYLKKKKGARCVDRTVYLYNDDTKDILSPDLLKQELTGKTLTINTDNIQRTGIYRVLTVLLESKVILSSAGLPYTDYLPIQEAQRILFVTDKDQPLSLCARDHHKASLFLVSPETYCRQLAESSDYPLSRLVTLPKEGAEAAIAALINNYMR